MGRPRLGVNLKKRMDYTYDFSHQREIAIHLTSYDINLIAEKLRISKTAIYYWCNGNNRSARIEKLAKILAEANKEKLRMIEQLIESEAI
jgi:hypothetical protein